MSGKTDAMLAGVLLAALKDRKGMTALEDGALAAGSRCDYGRGPHHRRQFRQHVWRGERSLLKMRYVRREDWNGWQIAASLSPLLLRLPSLGDASRRGMPH